RGAGGEPAAGAGDLEAADGGAVAGSAGQLGDDRIARQRRRLDRRRVELLERRLLARRGRRVDARVVRRPELGAQVLVVLPGIAPGDGGDLGGQQIQNDAVLVGRVDAAVPAQEAGAGALLAAEAEAAVDETAHEPLEADRHLAQRPFQVGG